jgi:hypothetical protein
MPRSAALCAVLLACLALARPAAANFPPQFCPVAKQGGPCQLSATWANFTTRFALAYLDPSQPGATCTTRLTAPAVGNLSAPPPVCWDRMISNFMNVTKVSHWNDYWHQDAGCCEVRGGSADPGVHAAAGACCLSCLTRRSARSSGAAAARLVERCARATLLAVRLVSLTLCRALAFQAGICQRPTGEALRVATANGAYVPASGAVASSVSAAVLVASVASMMYAAF